MADAPRSNCKPLEPTTMLWAVFDAVGTLIVPRESVAETYRACGALHGSQRSRGDVQSRFVEAFSRSETLSFLDGAAPYAGLATSETAERVRWRWVIGQIFDGLPATAQDAVFAALWTHYASPAAWRALPCVGAALHGLRSRGWRIAVASNFDRRLAAVLAGLPELPAVDAVLVSSEIGWRKPASEFYRSVIDQCGGAAERLRWIGDHPEHDFQGPRAAGIATLLIDERAAPNDPVRVRCLSEVALRLGSG